MKKALLFLLLTIRVFSSLKEEITLSRELWRPFVLDEEQKDPAFFSKLNSLLSDGIAARIQEGDGGAYLLYDKKGMPHFIIKPTDEDIYCLNNPKSHPSILAEKRARTNIPLYQSAQRAACSYEVAKLAGLESITPKTYLTILTLPQFFLLYPNGSLEKLCSVQEYIPNSTSLRSVLESLFAHHLQEEDLMPYFDESDFTKLSLLIWLTYDNDAHAGNLLTSPKDITTYEATTYNLKKIDNSLTFPEKNTDFFHFLMHFPHAKEPLSPFVKEKIRALPLKALETSLSRFDLAPSLPALKERIYVLQELIKRPHITYYEVSLRLLLLQEDNGLQLALSSLSLKELETLSPPLL